MFNKHFNAKEGIKTVCRIKERYSDIRFYKFKEIIMKLKQKDNNESSSVSIWL